MSKLKSVCYYTQPINTGAEYAIREDGAVFSRNKGFSHRLGHYTKSKWERDIYWETENTFNGLPELVWLGFATNGPHSKVETTRLRLPQE